MIFVVPSPSTETFDRGEKFTRYRTLESLTDYVLVSLERVAVEHFARQDGGGWRLHTYDQPAQTVTLTEIYERVDFPGAG